MPAPVVDGEEHIPGKLPRGLVALAVGEDVVTDGAQVVADLVHVLGDGELGDELGDRRVF